MKKKMMLDEIDIVSGGRKGTCRCYNNGGEVVTSAGYSYGDSCYNYCCTTNGAYRWSLTDSRRIPYLEGLCSYGKPGHSNNGWDPVTDVWQSIKKRTGL